MGTLHLYSLSNGGFVVTPPMQAYSDGNYIGCLLDTIFPNLNVLLRCLVIWGHYHKRLSIQSGSL